MKTKVVTYCGLFTALAMIFSYIETLLPFSIGVAGAKLGLPNIAIMVVLYLIGEKEAVYIDILRIFLTAMLFGNMSAFIFSFCGGMLSIIVMILIKKCKYFSIQAVSVCGGVAHNTGQLLAAIFIMQTPGIAFYLPVLMITGVITGIVNGIVAGIITKYLHKLK